MMNKIIYALLFIIFSIPSVGFCESDMDGTRRHLEMDSINWDESSGPKRLQMDHNEIPGFWFRRDIALNILSDLKEFEIRKQEIKLLEDVLKIRTAQSTRLLELIAIERQATAKATEAMEAAERRALEAEREKNVWWKSPILWFVVGAVVVVGIEAAAIAAIRSID